MFLGDGTTRCHPPDGVEHKQLERFLDDDDILKESFDRFVFWFSDDTGTRLRELADDTTPGSVDDACDLLKRRREALLEHQLRNLDTRVLADLLETQGTSALRRDRQCFHAEVDSRDHGWLSVEI